MGTEKNALTIAIRTRPTNGAWTNRNTLTPGITQNGAIQVTGGAVFLETQSYEVEITITDKTGISPLVLRTTILTTVVALDLNGDSVGVGKMHERGALDVGGDGYATNWRADQNVYAGGTVLCPIGAAVEWPGPLNKIPPGYFIEDGRALSRTTYAELFAIYGTLYGAGNGSTTFNIRDKRGRTGVGVNPADPEFASVGATFGTKTHTLTVAEIPSHPHTIAGNTAGYTSGGANSIHFGQGSPTHPPTHLG